MSTSENAIATRSVAAPKGSPKRVAILGCGNVGREVASRLIDAGERLGVQVVKILVRDTARDRGLPPDLFTASIDEVVDAQPDLVVELIGGLEPAASLVSLFLSRGVPVVTANKTLIAHQGRELGALAHINRTTIAHEAAVCAAIPILAALDQLRGDRILSIRGIVNGSCNFILSRLDDGWRFDEALAEARKRGLVEPDPSADISGRDSAEKLCILAAAAGFPLRPDQIETTGIAAVTPEDCHAARRSGRAIRLLAELDLSTGSPRARVGPTLLPRHHPLAQTTDELNAVFIESCLGGELVLKGRGAGPGPTASAVLGDVARLVSTPALASRAEPAPWPPRRHLIRVPSATPDTVLDAARSVGPAQLDLTRTAALIETEPVRSEQALACARALGPALVAPILETRR